MAPTIRRAPSRAPSVSRQSSRMASKARTAACLTLSRLSVMARHRFEMAATASDPMSCSVLAAISASRAACCPHSFRSIATRRGTAGGPTANSAARAAEPFFLSPSPSISSGRTCLTPSELGQSGATAGRACRAASRICASLSNSALTRVGMTSAAAGEPRQFGSASSNAEAAASRTSPRRATSALARSGTTCFAASEPLHVGSAASRAVRMLRCSSASVFHLASVRTSVVTAGRA